MECFLFLSQNKCRMLKQQLNWYSVFQLFQLKQHNFIQGIKHQYKNSTEMYSVDKSGKIKKQIDRYFLPLQINPNMFMDIIRQEQKKGQSPNKIKQDALNKLSEETKKFEMLRVTGKQLNSNFIPFNIKAGKTHTNSNINNNLNRRQSSRETKLSPKKQKQFYKYKIQQILNEPLEQLVQVMSRDPQSHLFSRQLQQLSKYRNTTISDTHLSMKTPKVTFNSQPIENQLETQSQSKSFSNRQHFQNIIMSNPSLYRKMLLAYHKLETEKNISIPSCQKRQKRATLSEAIISKRMTKNYKKVLSISQKQLTPHEMKRLINYIQYRQFLLTINLSNRVVIFPENQMQYKAFVCKGNNGLLVKSIIKSRPWWALRSASDIENCTLVWTEWKKNRLIASLPSGGREKDGKVQKMSFYASNYYQRISQSTSLDQGETKQDSKNISKTQTISRQNQASFSKINHVCRIINLQNSILGKYFNTDQSDGSYFTFTKKINQKKFEQLSKKFLPANPSYYAYSPKPPTQTPITKILNHIPGCLQLHSKKLLYLNMKKFYQKSNKDILSFLPETHLIKEGLQDQNFQKFICRFNELQSGKSQKKIKNIWICKPGQNSNRGNGITVVSTIEQVRAQIKQLNSHGHTLIVQKYMENPYLYCKRKFDIRCYLLITTVNGILKGYFFNEGYIRTTSKEYSLKNLENKFVHLTNDAIQKKGEQYGKFQSCNKVSFGEFQKYLESVDKEQPLKFMESRKKIKQIVIDILNATSSKLNPSRKQFAFQLFGLDFMLDHTLNPYLIEANSNPCLQVDGSVLSKIIPSLIQNTLRVALDPLFPPPYGQSWKNSRFSPGNPFQMNKFQLVYDSLEDPNAYGSANGKVDGKEQLKEMIEEEEMGKQEENWDQ